MGRASLANLAAAFLGVAACGVETVNDSQVAVVSVPAVSTELQLLEQAALRFYATHADRYDMLVLWPSRALPGSAYYLPVANDTLGIGYGQLDRESETFNRASDFGSASVQGIVRMGSAWPVIRATGGHDSILGVLSQETGHRWGPSIDYLGQDGQERSSLLTGDRAHWSFFVGSGNSPLGGNNWTEVDVGRYRATPGPLAYSPLDLYLMGLLPAAEVPPIQLLVDVVGCPASQCSSWGPTTTELEVTARVESITIDQIIAAEGPRVPSAAEPVLRQAWLYVHTDGEEPDPDAIDYLEELRGTWEQSFAAATGGRGAVGTDL